MGPKKLGSSTTAGMESDRRIDEAVFALYGVDGLPD